MAGQVVTVTGTGYAEQGRLAECTAGATGPTQCDLRTLVDAPLTGNGTFTASVTLIRNLVTTDGSVDCADAPGTCAIASATGGGTTVLTSQPLTFDPDGPTVDAHVEVTPATGLLDGQAVVVHGDGWLPGDTGRVQQCRTQSSCSGRRWWTVTVDGSGDFLALVPVELRVLTIEGDWTSCDVVGCAIGARVDDD